MTIRQIILRENFTPARMLTRRRGSLKPIWQRRLRCVRPERFRECSRSNRALDELAYKLKIDPLELRLINYAEKDPDNGKEWSSKELKKAYTEAAEKFGWKNRKPEPRSCATENGLSVTEWRPESGAVFNLRRPFASF